MHEKQGAATWPLNLYAAVFGGPIAESELPPDFNEAMEYVLTEMMSANDATVLRSKYQEGLSYSEIGKRMGITTEGVRYNATAAIRRMRHIKRLKYLRYGLEAGERNNPDNAPIEQVGIENLDLNNFILNCLKRAGIDTVGQLIGHTEKEVLRFRGFGNRSLVTLKSALSQHGLELRDEP